MQKTSKVKKRVDSGIAALLAEVRQLIATARNVATSTVNTLQVLTNFEVGRRIVEHEQKSERRAEYGAEVLKELYSVLTAEFSKKFSVTNLKLMRKFFVDFSPRIGRQTPDQFSLGPALRQLHWESTFTMSWIHYVLLLIIMDIAERNFYEIEATNQGWSVPELKRQKASALYERLELSRDKDGIRNLATEGQLVTKPDANPTVGLLLVNSRREAIVELILPQDVNIHARAYQLYLPSKALLRRKLIEWTEKVLK